MLQHLIWVYTVCKGLSVPILRLLLIFWLEKAISASTIIVLCMFPLMTVWCFIAQGLSLSSLYCLDMTEIMLKKTSKNCQINITIVCILQIIASSLPHVAKGHMQCRPKACMSKLYGTATYISLLSNQTGNKHFVCSLSGSQLMWQI